MWRTDGTLPNSLLSRHMFSGSKFTLQRCMDNHRRDARCGAVPVIASRIVAPTWTGTFTA